LKRPWPQRTISSPPGSPTSPQATDSLERRLDDSIAKQEATKQVPTFTSAMVETPVQSNASLLPLPSDEDGDVVNDYGVATPNRLEKQDTRETSSIDGLAPQDLDVADVLPEESEHVIGPLLRRTNSYSTFVERALSLHNIDHSIPRTLSFSVATESNCLSRPTVSERSPETASPKRQLADEKAHTTYLQSLRSSLADLSRTEAVWTSAQIDSLDALLDSADSDNQFVESALQVPTKAYTELKDMAAAALRDEKEALKEGRKELEMLAAKLDYEIESLKGKVEDVHVGVDDFERAVAGVEQKVDELEAEGRGGLGWGCIVS